MSRPAGLLAAVLLGLLLAGCEIAKPELPSYQTRLALPLGEERLDMAEAIADELGQDALARIEVIPTVGLRCVDVMPAAGLGDRGYGMGAAVGDVDGFEQEAVELGASERGGHWRSSSTSSSQPSSVRTVFSARCSTQSGRAMRWKPWPRPLWKWSRWSALIEAKVR